MREIYLINYSVKGIKTLDQLVSLSFYKKIIPKNPDMQEYNIKGIYGMNGSGKSGIVTSVNILRNILTNPGYLNNPIVQKNLDEIINKEIKELVIEADYIAKFSDISLLFRYKLILAKDDTGKYVIAYEQLSSKKASSQSDVMEIIFEVSNGELISIMEEQEEFAELIKKKTTNLLSTASMCALFYEKILIPAFHANEEFTAQLFYRLIILFAFGKKLFVYLDQSDDHRQYFIADSLKGFGVLEDNKLSADILMDQYLEMDGEQLNVIAESGNLIPKGLYVYFEKAVNKLYEFLHIFKSDLQGIEIDKKEDHDIFICSLIMVYDSYRIHAEFESTGIKKLIRLFAYLKEMVRGGIVFIDEFDSNLHDVYLCALLEYLMEYGKGQLCFTTHNVGPMDILRRRKKSIDFLSVDHKIYPWTTNGNYSPSKLYRNGMIEGSPFNVEAIDFIGVFEIDEEEE